MAVTLLPLKHILALPILYNIDMVQYVGKAKMCLKGSRVTAISFRIFQTEYLTSSLKLL